MKEKETKIPGRDGYRRVDIPGIDPMVEPIGDPPVPNRAWTEMKLGRDIDTLTEEEKSDLYIGHDHIL